MGELAIMLFLAFMGVLGAAWGIGLWRRREATCPETFAYHRWPGGLYRALARTGGVCMGLAGAAPLFLLVWWVVAQPDLREIPDDALSGHQGWLWAWVELFFVGMILDAVTAGRFPGANPGLRRGPRPVVVMSVFVQVAILLSGVFVLTL